MCNLLYFRNEMGWQQYNIDTDELEDVEPSSNVELSDMLVEKLFKQMTNVEEIKNESNKH